MPDFDAIEAKLNVLIDRISPGGSRWLAVDGASSYSGLSENSIRRLLSAGRLTSYRPVPGRVIIDRRELDSLIQSSTRRPNSGRGRRTKGKDPNQ